MTRKRLLRLLFINVLMLLIFFPGNQAKAESIMTAPFFHLSKVKGGEFYTADLSEKDEMIKNHGYADMGVTCYIVGPEATQPSGMVPLFRLKFTGDFEGTAFNEYLYTTSQDEVTDYMNKSGWDYEGISGYVIEQSSNFSETVPLYRWYCPCSYHWHGYSRDINDTWITKLHQGTQYESIACRVWPKESSIEVSGLNLNAPYDLKAVDSGRKVRLTWKNPFDKNIEISIERKASGASFHQIAIVDGEITSYIDDSISSGNTYVYRVRAFKDDQFSLPSNEAQVYIDDGRNESYNSYNSYDSYHNELLEDYTGTEDPFNLRVTVLSYSSICLTWDDCFFPTLGYHVERRSNNGSFVTVANISFRDRSFTDSGLDRDTRYYYRVRAYNLIGDSDYSDEIPVCTSSYYDESDEEWRPNIDYDDESKAVIIKLQVGSKKYYVNQSHGTMDTAPFISGGRTLVPIRFLAESIGADVDWNDYERKATVTQDGNVIELWAGRNTARINGTRAHIDNDNAQLTPIINNGRIMLPLRFITENLGFDVYWIEASKEIILTYSF